MSHYHHLSISEREKILVLRTEGKNLREIAGEIGRCVSTVSRELKRNRCGKQEYSAIEAEKKYRDRRKRCRRRKLLSNVELQQLVRRLFWKNSGHQNKLSIVLRMKTARSESVILPSAGPSMPDCLILHSNDAPKETAEHAEICAIAGRADDAKERWKPEERL